MLKHKDEVERYEYYLINLDDVNDAFQQPEESMRIEANIESIRSACIKCIDPRCMKFFDNEYICNEVTGFSADVNNSVCPVDAIHWSDEPYEIEINSIRCIRCGICIKRCPFGAIHFTSNGGIQINTNRSSSRYEIIELSDDVRKIQSKCIQELESVTSNRIIQKVSDLSIENIYHTIRNERWIAPLLCRNIFISLGYNCSIRRPGDVYTRTDAIFDSDNTFGVIEIELDSDSLSAARNLLDDLAIIQSRHGIDSKSVIPVALCLSIPNKRQGYFQVCDDIKRVLGVQIRTLTIGSLLILLWAGGNLVFTDHNFELGFRNNSIETDLLKLIGEESMNIKDCQGVFESIK